MKRILALILTILMLAALLPTSIVAQAETVTKEGFYLVNWGRDFEPGTYEYFYSMPYTWINSANYNADSTSINIGVYFSDDTSSSDIQTAAKKMWDEFAKVPAGARYLNLAAMASVFKACVKDAIDMEDGVRLVADWLDRFLKEYKSIGGELDGIAIDLEYNYYTSFYLQSYFCCTYTEGGVTKDPRNLDILQDIVRNERVYQKIIRPQLVEYEKQGLFKFYTKNINPATGLPYDLSTAIGPEYSNRVPIPVSEITTINRYSDNGGDSTSGSTWGFVVQKYLMDCITRATYEPLIKYYPDAVLSDYSNADVYSWHRSMSTSGSATGTSNKAGNASNGVYYGSQFSEYFWASYSGSTTRKLYYKPASCNDAVFDPTDKFTRILYDINNQKRILASTRDKMGDDAKVNIWISGYNYADAEKSYGASSYFTELMYHLGMTDPEPFLGYVLKQDSRGVNMHEIRTVTNDILAELTRVAGASDRKAIETPMDWNSDYILSGMYAGGRNIWRITPDTSVISVEDFKVKDYAPTFKVGDVTVTFPQGRIIEDSAISKIGSCGYWVETPANVSPVVTSTADHYENNPAFGETFTNYKTGTFFASYTSMLTTTSGRPDTYWSANGTAEIKANGGNQTMALSGTTTLTNSKVAENVTAGDYYAKQQMWEVKVTLPSGNYGDVKLLSCHSADGGLKITGGKVYYDQSGAYQELSGVTLAAGTYTVKREVDFRTEGKYTGSYTIYDSNGKRLGGTDFVAMAAKVTVPVSKITISTTGASAAVELDDYKLYATGVTTVLDLYNTTRGTKLTTTTPTEDTGYRLSWMNAGDTYQVARIYDAKTGKIIKTINMAPGTDGVAADIVKIGAGQQIQFAVNVQDVAAPTVPDYDNGNFRWTAVSESIGLATGEKPAGGNDDVQQETPPVTDDEEEDNIFDIVGGDGEDLNNGSGDPIIPGGDNGSIDDPGDAESPDNTEAPGEGDPDDPGKQGMGGGMIALIVILSLAVLAGAGYAAYVFIVKPKLFARTHKETTEE